MPPIPFGGEIFHLPSGTVTIYDCLRTTNSISLSIRVTDNPELNGACQIDITSFWGGSTTWTESVRMSRSGLLVCGVQFGVDTLYDQLLTMSEYTLADTLDVSYLIQDSETVTETYTMNGATQPFTYPNVDASVKEYLADNFVFSNVQASPGELSADEEAVLSEEVSFASWYDSTNTLNDNAAGELLSELMVDDGFQTWITGSNPPIAPNSISARKLCGIAGAVSFFKCVLGGGIANFICVAATGISLACSIAAIFS